MRSKRKLGIIALAASVAAILLAVPIFTATNIINGVSIPASTNRFSMMAITGRSTQTTATNWHQLTPANPASPRSVACKRVVVNPAKNFTVLPEVMSGEPICVQLSVADGGYNQWRLYPPNSSLSALDQEYLNNPQEHIPGLSLSPSGILNISSKTDGINSAGTCFAVEARSGHNKHFSTLLLLNVISPGRHWAGYIMQGGTFNGVSATFDVPRDTSVVCNRDAAGGYCDEAVWAGVGGYDYGSGSLIQAGISERVIAGTHKISHLGAWFELYPAPSLHVNLPVHQGDQVSVNIHKTVTPNLWLIQITNDTTGQTFSTLQIYTGSTSSAEWIVEAPEWANFPWLGPSGSFSLPTLTPVTFTHPWYSLTTPDKRSWHTLAWINQRHTHALVSRVFSSHSFVVASFPTTNKKGNP